VIISATNSKEFSRETFLKKKALPKKTVGGENMKLGDLVCQNRQAKNY
jgi:hypothetical protein